MIYLVILPINYFVSSVIIWPFSSADGFWPTVIGRVSGAMYRLSSVVCGLSVTNVVAKW